MSNETKHARKSADSLPPEWTKEAASLNPELRDATRTGHPVDLSVVSHMAITLALHALAYDPELNGREVPITYSDGSSPPAFPLGRLRTSRDVVPSGGRTLRLGVMSNRHPEFDFLVDVNVNSNAELSTDIPMAQEDEVSCANATRLLEEALTPGTLQQCLILEVYHSGLEPMVVGFYRAVEAFLFEHGSDAAVIIIPKFFKPDNENGVRNVLLTPSSPGALAKSYLSGPIWS